MEEFVPGPGTAAKQMMEFMNRLGGADVGKKCGDACHAAFACAYVSAIEIPSGKGHRAIEFFTMELLGL